MLLGVTLSISFVEFKKLLHPAIPEKFKLIYEILYYYKIDIDELVNLTADHIINEKLKGENRQGILLTNGKFIELPNNLFDRIVNFLEFNDKKWGTSNAKMNRNKLNYVFESNKKGHAYTIPTLYKKFKEHCIKVGILRDLALGSLINTDLGRFISIINSELSLSDEKLTITFFSFESEEISALLKYYIVHLNYEEIISYKKEKPQFGCYESFSYPYLDINLFTFINTISEEMSFLDEIENSRAIFVYAIPSQENKNFIVNLLKDVYVVGGNKFISFVVNDSKSLLPKLETIVKEFRPWMQYIPMHLAEMKNISIVNTIEEFFIFLLEKFNSIDENSNDEYPKEALR